MHHLRLTEPSLATPSPRTGTRFFLSHHELGPLPLKTPGGHKISPHNALGVLLDRRLECVEAF
jgi:hypothetical protein